MVAHGGTSVAGSFIQTLDDGRRRELVGPSGMPAGDARERPSSWQAMERATETCFPLAHSRRRLPTMTARL